MQTLTFTTMGKALAVFAFCLQPVGEQPARKLLGLLTGGSTCGVQGGHSQAAGILEPAGRLLSLLAMGSDTRLARAGSWALMGGSAG